MKLFRFIKDLFAKRALITHPLIATILGSIYFIIIGKPVFIMALAISLILIALALHVVRRNLANEINLSFGVISFSLAAWVFIHLVFIAPQKMAYASFWDYFIFVPAIVFSASFLYFTYVFPSTSKRFSNLKKAGIFVAVLLMLILLGSGSVIKGVSLVDGQRAPVFSFGYPIFVLFILFCAVRGVLNLFQKYRRSSGINRLQLKYIFLGTLITSLSLALTNLILPWFGFVWLAHYGPFSVVFFIGFSSYAIIKHRLMSIEIVVQRSFVYIVSTIAVALVYLGLVFTLEISFKQEMSRATIFITTLTAVLVATFYYPLVNWFRSITERVLLGERYDYQRAIKEVGNAITSVIKLEDLTRSIVITFVDTMHVSEISFLILDLKRGRYRSVAIELKEGIGRYKRIEIDEKSPIISWLRAAKDILVLDEVENEIIKLNTSNKDLAVRRKLLMDVMDEMKRIGMNVWVPILFKKELTGVICLGAKLSGRTFTSEDLSLLSALANQTALALENARLYAEVVNMKNYSEEILNSMVSGVITTDMRGDITTFNPTAEEITGCKSGDIVGKNYKDVFQSGCAFDKFIAKAINNTTVSNKEDAFISYEKGKVPVSISTNLLYDGQGRKIGVLLSMMDMTEIKELENKVRRADKLGALGTMAAGMAHEIKNPLSSMKVLSQLLPIKFKDDEFRKKFIDIMPKEISRIDRIVESLLGFARASAPKFEEQDINSLLDEQIKYYKRQADEGKVKIVEKFNDLPHISGDHDQLIQVFSNLILNAIHAMPNGGHLIVETKSGKKIGDAVQNITVMISDTGHGIAPDHLKKLFDPFFTTKYAGTGLGLTISHSIIDGHHGYIDVNSELGKGTTFKVTLPVGQELV